MSFTNKINGYSTIAYFSGSILYSSYMSYCDGVKELEDFIKNGTKYQDYSDDIIYDNEFDAIKYGCNKELGKHLWNGLIFPFSISSNIVPFIVSKLN